MVFRVYAYVWGLGSGGHRLQRHARQAARRHQRDKLHLRLIHKLQPVRREVRAAVRGHLHFHAARDIWRRDACERRGGCEPRVQPGDEVVSVWFEVCASEVGGWGVGCGGSDLGFGVLGAGLRIEG